MGIIRKVKESDYDFICNAIEDYKLKLCYGYTKYFMQVIMGGRHSLTLVYEEENIIKAFYCVITQPKSFMEEFYSYMPFFKKLKYHINNQISTYSVKKTENTNIPAKIQYIVNNLYSVNDNFVYSCFIYSKAGKTVSTELFKEICNRLVNDYNFLVSVIKKSNTVSLFVHNMIFHDNIELFDVDEEGLFFIIDIKKFCSPDAS